MSYSLNGNLILKPYQKQKKLESKQVVTGLQGVAQKDGIEKMELLVDTLLSLGDNQKVVPKGSLVYFREETLHVQKWPRAVLKSEDYPEGFVIGNIRDVLYIEEGCE